MQATEPVKALKKKKAPAPKKAKGVVPNHGVGRRKSAVARVWLRRGGTGKIQVNGEEYLSYFDTDLMRLTARTAFEVVPHAAMYDAEVNVQGGGLCGQADAVKLGIARAFLDSDAQLRPLLRENGLLTVDSRLKERKKFGQRGARRKFQFVKR